MYVMCLNTTPTWTRYHQLRLCRQLMMQQKHHQHGHKIHQLRQCCQLMMQQKHHQPCMDEYMTQQQYIYSTTHSPTPLDIISYITFNLHTCIHQLYHHQNFHIRNQST